MLEEMTRDVGEALRALGRTQVRDTSVRAREEPAAPGPVMRRQPLRPLDGVDLLVPSEPCERDAAIDKVLGARYYPVGHSRLHIVKSLDLNAIGPVGRFDEVSPLKTCILTMPSALAGDFSGSPNATAFPRINTHRAFLDHAQIVRDMLERGATVYLLSQPGLATEASFNTDVVTGIGRSIVVSSPLHPARRIELQAYSGGLWLDSDGSKGGSVEWGDTLQARRGRVHYLVQGYCSMRADWSSVERVERFVHAMRKAGHNIVHVPVKLAGADTLHLDYAVNYAGEGKKRSMLIAPHAFADADDIDKLRGIFGVEDRGVFNVSHADMLDGVANISCPNPREAFMGDDKACDAAVEFFRSRGIEVLRRRLQHKKKDGKFHCIMGQALRV